MSMRPLTLLCCVMTLAVSPAIFGSNKTPRPMPECHCPDLTALTQQLARGGSPAFRRELAAVLECLRARQLAGGLEDPGREARIKALEDLALDDVQRLSTQLSKLGEAQAAGAGVAAQMAMAEQSLATLLPVAVMTADGTAKLVTRPYTIAVARRDAAAKAAKEIADCRDRTKVDDLATAAAVQRCIDVVTSLAHLDIRQLERLQDRGARIAASNAEALRAVKKKLAATKDEAKLKELDKQRSDFEDDIALLTRIAVVPAAERSCRDFYFVRNLDDAVSVRRCAGVLQGEIEAMRHRHGEHALDPLQAALDISPFSHALARIEDRTVVFEGEQRRLQRLKETLKSVRGDREKAKLEDELTRLQFEIEADRTMLLPEPAAHLCNRTELSLGDFNDAKECVRRLALKIDRHQLRVDREVLDDGTEELVRLLRETQTRGTRLAEEQTIEIVRLTKIISASKDDAEKKQLTAQQDLAKEQFAILDAVAVDPTTRRRCLEERDSDLTVHDPTAMVRCIEAVSDEIQRLQIASLGSTSKDPVVETTISQLKRRLARLQDAGAVIAEEAHANAQVAAAAAPKDDAGSGKDDKKEKKSDTAAAPALAPAVTRLDQIAVEASARRTCVDNPNVHLKITDIVFVSRCVTALQSAVDEIDPRRNDLSPEERTDLKRFTLELARFEEQGRRLAKIERANLAELQSQHDKASSPEKQASYDEAINKVKADLAHLPASVITPDTDAQKEYADFEQWFNELYMGYAYTSISDAFAKGFPRVGATIGFHYPRESVPEASTSWHPGGYGVYHTFVISLTNSGEATSTDLSTFATKSLGKTVGALDDGSDPTTTPATGDTTPVKVKPVRALEFEGQFFWPWWRNDFQIENPRLRTRIGPLLVLGARKLDAEAFAHHRAYFGLRSARSPDTFYDVLIGRTGSLVSRRLEVRGQYVLPFAFNNGAHLAVGATGNFGITKRRHEDCLEDSPHCRQNEPDAIGFYLTYQIGGNEFLGAFK